MLGLLVLLLLLAVSGWLCNKACSNCSCSSLSDKPTPGLQLAPKLSPGLQLAPKLQTEFEKAQKGVETRPKKHEHSQLDSIMAFVLCMYQPSYNQSYIARMTGCAALTTVKSRCTPGAGISSPEHAISCAVPSTCWLHHLHKPDQTAAARAFMIAITHVLSHNPAACIQQQRALLRLMLYLLALQDLEAFPGLYSKVMVLHVWTLSCNHV